MELNKIKLLNKEELQWRLKQGGFDEVAKILEDKDVDGKTLLELKEFEIFKWKLNQFQKRNLWNCISQIKDKPAILMIKEKPKVKNKSFPITGKPVERVELNEVYKKKLQDLSSATDGRSSTLSKVGKSKLLISDQNKSKTSSKPLPAPPPPSPPPRNDVKNTDTVTKRTALSLPKPTNPESSNEMTDDYLEMNAPLQTKEQGSIGDYYLSPIEVSAPYKNKSPNLTKKWVPNERIAKNVKPDERTSFGSIKSTTNSLFTNAHSLSDEYVEETYDNPDNTYELSPPVNSSREDNNRLNNAPRGKSPLNIASNQDIHDYKQSPAHSSTRENLQKPSVKDLRNHILVVEENMQETKFPFFPSKFNIFKMKNKSKNLYENCNIQGAQQKHVEILVKNRPLPEIPSSPTCRPVTLFSRPFPPPRDTSLEFGTQDNYVELVNTFPVPEKLFTSQGTEESDDQNEIYENTPGPQNADDDKQLIYKNTTKTQNFNGEEDIYENSSNAQESILEPPTTLRTKKYVGGNLFRQVLPMESKGKPLTEVTTNTNLSVPKSSVQDLASLLSQELMKINQKRQNQEQIEDSETESEFDYDEDDDVNEQIYGNILNDDENSQSQIPNDQVTEVAVSDNRYDNSSHREDKKIPIYKRALPEIPRNITPPNTALKNDSSPRPPIKRGEIFKTQLIENRNFNSPTKEEKSVKRNSTLEVPRPIYSSYEDHTMKRAEAGSSKEKERDGFDNIFDVSEEPFYRDTTRKGAKQLLSKSGNGIFLIRPSRTYFLVLTVKNNNRIYNFGIERTSNNKLRLNTEGNIKPPEFSTLRDFVTYFINEPVTFENGDELTEIYLKTYLPHDSS